MKALVLVQYSGEGLLENISFLPKKLLIYLYISDSLMSIKSADLVISMGFFLLITE